MNIEDGRKGGGKQAKPDELTLTASTPKITGGSNTVRVRVGIMIQLERTKSAVTESIMTASKFFNLDLFYLISIAHNNEFILCLKVGT
jgi:hypothetical protein